MKTTTHLAHVCALLLLLGCGGTQTPPATSAQSGPSSILVNDALGHPHIGDKAPDFELVDQQGQAEKLSALRGQVVVLALVSSWCPFSKAAQPHLAELAETYAARGVKTLGVVIADDEAGYRAYLARTNMPFPIAFDAGDQVALAYAPEHAHPSFKDRRKVSVSANLVIDPNGVIRYFGLADTTHFDANLDLVRAELDRELSTAP